MADASSWATKPTPKVHDKASDAGKFDDSFMGSGKNDDTATPKSTQPAGSYPIAGGSEGTFAKPTHAAGTLIPNK